MSNDDMELDHAMFGNAAEMRSGADISLEDQLKANQQHLAELPETATDIERGRVQLDIAETLLALERKEEAWNIARETVDPFIKAESWQDAVEAFNVLAQCEQPASMSALGQGVWLAVTFPIQPDTTVAILNHIIDETPNDSDGAAVAAMTAHYIADIRSPEEKHQSLTFFTMNNLARVAKRHSNVNTQAEMDMWLAKLQLKDPQLFLPKLSLVLNTLVEDNWWFDRDALREKLPVN